jgi:hypothetical protein
MDGGDQNFERRSVASLASAQAPAARLASGEVPAVEEDANAALVKPRHPGHRPMVDRAIAEVSLMARRAFSKTRP